MPSAASRCHLARPRQRQPLARHEDDAERGHRDERDRVQHDCGANRAIGRRAEKDLHRNLIGQVKPTDRPRRRHRHADDQDGHHQERSPKRERNMKCLRRQPDPSGDREPQRNRERERDRAAGVAGASPRAPAKTSRRTSPRLRASRSRQYALDAERQSAHAFGMTGQHEQTTATPATAAAAASRPPTLTRANCAGSPETTPGSTVSTNHANSSRTATRSSSRSRMIVANAAVALRPLASGQQIRPNDLAGSGRQQERRGEADNRRAKGDAEVRAADAARADTASGRPEAYVDAGDRRPPAGAAPGWRGGFRPKRSPRSTLRRKNAQQPEGQQEDQGGANSWLHAPGLVGIRSGSGLVGRCRSVADRTQDASRTVPQGSLQVYGKT